jgi:hypothetical protein
VTPKDHDTVTLGIKLYENYKGQMSLSEFKSELAKYINRFSRCSPDSEPVAQIFAKAWPYPVGYFNNKGNPYKLPSNRCP